MDVHRPSTSMQTFHGNRWCVIMANIQAVRRFGGITNLPNSLVVASTDGPSHAARAGSTTRTRTRRFATGPLAPPSLPATPGVVLTRCGNGTQPAIDATIEAIDAINANDSRTE